MPLHFKGLSVDEIDDILSGCTALLVAHVFLHHCRFCIAFLFVCSPVLSAIVPSFVNK